MDKGDRRQLQPGTEALFVLVRKVTADKVLEGLKGEAGTVHSITPGKRRCLAGVQAALPGSPACRPADKVHEG
jgi:uncharacterized membrane protein